MFDLVHEMRTRIITSPSFDGDRMLGAILFEDTMDRDDRRTPDRRTTCGTSSTSCPFLKVDKGLADEQDGAQVMKPIPGLDELLDRAPATRASSAPRCARSIKLAGRRLQAVVDQQFEIGRQILAAGLVPIIEPEVDIHSPQKAEAEDQLKAALLEALDRLDDGQAVMLKLTLPEHRQPVPRPGRRTPRCCGWWRCPAATPRRGVRRSWRATTG